MSRGFGDFLTYDVEVTTETRPTLSRERVIEAAVAYADEHGIDDMSMRKLGAQLSVEAMSLYNHVDDKADLHMGMIDFVFSSIALPDSNLDWKDQTRDVGKSAMEAFGRHNWVVYLLMQHGNTGPGSLRFMDHVVGILLNAGFNEADTHHAWQMLASHTMGYAFQSANGPGVHDDEYAKLEAQMAQLSVAYPNVARIAPDLIDCAFDREYMFGLEIIIDGLESRRR
jgi:AcrR family transcriptional regulator